MKVISKKIALTFAYMIGMQRLEDYYNADLDLIELLEDDPDATAVRNFMTVLTFLMKHSEDVDCRLKGSLGDFSALEPVADAVLGLGNRWLDILPENATAQKLFACITGAIDQIIDDCRHLYPDWVAWRWIRRAFVVPNYESEKAFNAAIDTYRANFNAYPFGLFAHLPRLEPNGNILRNDLALLHTLAHESKCEFCESWRCYEYAETDLDDAEPFFAPGAVGLVDCENFDVFRFVNVLSAWHAAENKPRKIYLITDQKANHAWSYLPQAFPTTQFEFVSAERLSRNKSLVDHILIATLCRLVFQDKLINIVIFSSDSDFAAIAKALDQEDLSLSCVFEPDKVGGCTLDVYKELGVKCINACAEFAGNDNSAIQAMFVRFCLAQNFSILTLLDLKEMVQTVCTETWLPEDSARKLVSEIITQLRFRVDGQGNLEFYFTE